MDALEFLTTGDSAHVLGISPDGVRFLDRTGRLRAIRTVSGLRLFRRCDVEKLAAARARRRTRERVTIS